MKVELTQDVHDLPVVGGAGKRTRPATAGEVVEVDDNLARAMIRSGQAKEKQKRGGRARTGPEETR